MSTKSTQASSTSSPSPIPKADNFTINLVNTLAISRIALGVGCMFAPVPIFRAFGVPLTPNLSILARMVGIRDIVLGDMLWTAKKDATTEEGRSEIRRALWAGIATDLSDAGSAGLALYGGHLAARYAGVFGVGAIGFVAMASYGLKKF